MPQHTMTEQSNQLAKVSVIIPILNGEKYILAALDSLLAERNINIDIIVIDDGCTDKSMDIVKQHQSKHPCIRCLGGNNKGVSAARNLGLSNIRPDTDYITFLDCDDLNKIGSIERHINLLIARPAAQFSYGLMQLFEEVDENNEIKSGTRTMIVKGVSLSAAVFKKSVFDTMDWFAEDLRFAEDMDFFLRLLETGVDYVEDDQVAILYRRHQDNVTNDVHASQRGFIDALRRSLQRRRNQGIVGEVSDLFKARLSMEEQFKNE